MGFLLQSAVAGGGVALLPAYVCCPAMATGQLVAVLPEWEIPPSALSLVMASLKNQSRIQAAFHSFVTRYDFSALTAADVPI
jgi:DNA-binding transcriptional LysR family regulator